MEQEIKKDMPEGNGAEENETNVVLEEFVSQKQKETDALKGMYEVLGKLEIRNRELREKSKE
jgi:hypothetical protein